MGCRIKNPQTSSRINTYLGARLLSPLPLGCPQVTYLVPPSRMDSVCAGMGRASPMQALSRLRIVSRLSSGWRCKTVLGNFGSCKPNSVTSPGGSSIRSVFYPLERWCSVCVDVFVALFYLLLVSVVVAALLLVVAAPIIVLLSRHGGAS